MTRVNIIDFIARKLKALVGIVQDTDTATVNIAKGKYVIWKGNPCKASSAISSGGTLSASNLTALTEGVGNDINSKITNITITQTNAATGRMLGKNNVRKWGRNVEVVVSCDTISPASNGWINIATLPVGNAYRPYETLDFGIANNADDTMVHGRIEDGVIKVYGKTGVSLAPIVLVHFISAE